jgi:Putative Ig domain
MKIAHNVCDSLLCSQGISRAFGTLPDKFIPPNLHAKSRTILTLLFGLGLLCSSSRAFAQSGTWTTKTPGPKTQIEPTGTALEGLFHLFGESNGSRASASPEVYDPGSSRWTTGGPAIPTRTSISAPTPPDLFGRLSTRALVGTGDNVLISGFGVAGTGTKKVLLRALGPSLTGVSNQLADPTLELRDSSGSLIFSNDNWRDTQEADIIATGQAPPNDLESAILATISPGSYTAIIAGNNNATGVGLAEILDVDTSIDSQLASISSRAFADTGDNVIVGGFTIDGPQSQQVIIRAIGPSLGIPGVLQDPTLELRNSSSNTLVFNNNWQDAQEAEITATGLAPTDVRESALVATLPPGSYTAVVAGVCSTTGVAAVEVYNLGLAGNTTEIPASSPLPCGPTPTPPVITSPLAASVTMGQPFVYQFEATGATSLAVSNPPPGLMFNANLGAIVGIPSAAETFQVGLSATNVAGTTTATLTITVQPAPTSGPIIVSSTSATGRTGRAFNFQLQTSGGSSATRFAVDGLPPGFSVDPSTGFISGTPTSDGNFSLLVSAIDGTAVTQATFQLTFISDPTVPIITSDSTVILTPGQFFSYTITADATGTFSYMGTDGIVYQGPSSAGLPAGLSFDGVDTISGVFSGEPISSVKIEAADHHADGGPRRIPGQSGGIVTNVQLFAHGDGGNGTFPLITFIAAKGTAQISTRMGVGTGDNVLIGGFIIAGTGTTKALIRAIGPSLTQFGVPDALPDPMLELRDGPESILGSSNNWRDNMLQEIQIIATGDPIGSLALTNDFESAILAYLSPGPYTAIVRGNNNTTGTALVEVYDLGIARPLPPDNARLANISTRGFVDTDNNVMIGGFIIGPPPPPTISTRVVIRAIGPSLSLFGVPDVLANPQLELHDAASLIAQNDDWQTTQIFGIITSDQVTEIQNSQLAPTNPAESAIIATLPQGSYTAIVRGVNNTTGNALVEIYALQ